MAVPTVEAVYTSVQGDGGNVGKAVTTDGSPTTDDYLVVCICGSANADAQTPPGGWTEATVPDNSIATGGGAIRAFYLKNPAASTTYTWTSSSGRSSIIGLLIRGADGTTFINQKSSLQSAPGANHTPPSVTTSGGGGSDYLIIDFAGLRQFSPDVADWTVPAAGLTWTERADIQGADGNNNIRLAAGTAAQSSAGAVPTNVWTQSDVFEDSIIIRLAINAAAGGGGTQNLTGTGIASGEAFGAGTVTPGVVTLSGTGIASAEAFGAGTVTTLTTVTGTGIASAEAFGSGTVTPGAVTVTGSGISSAETFGAGTVTPGAVDLAGSGIVSAEAFGAGTVSTGFVLVGAGITSGEAFGAGSVDPGPVDVTGTGIGSGETFGSGAVSNAGPPTQTLTGTGIGTGETFGNGTIATGPVQITGVGIPSGEVFGFGLVGDAEHQFIVGTNSSGSQGGIPSGEAFGNGKLTKLGRGFCDCDADLEFTVVFGRGRVGAS